MFASEHSHSGDSDLPISAEVKTLGGLIESSLPRLRIEDLCGKPMLKQILRELSGRPADTTLAPNASFLLYCLP